MGIDYQVRVEKALEGLNAFCADAEMRISRRTYSPRREPPSLPSGREDAGRRPHAVPVAGSQRNCNRFQQNGDWLRRSSRKT